jgi:sodium transport system permease protein
VALVFAARVFERENLLLGGKESVRSVLSLDRAGQGTATPGLALVSFAILQVALFYGSLLLMKGGFVRMILGSQYGLLLLPTLAIVWIMRLPAIQTLRLRMPDWRAMAGALLIGVSAWGVVSGITLRLMPPPESLSRALEKVLMIDDRSMPLWALWLLVAVTPALCEELFFRGLVMSGLRSFGKWQAIVIAALLFGVAHASIYRLLPTFCLGVLLGFVAWQSNSVLPSVILHALNNGLAITLARSPGVQHKLGLPAGSLFVPWPWVFAFSIVMIAGLALVKAQKPPAEYKSFPD